jgi:hypothetical protein
MKEEVYNLLEKLNKIDGQWMWSIETTWNKISKIFHKPNIIKIKAEQSPKSIWNGNEKISWWPEYYYFDSYKKAFNFLLKHINYVYKRKEDELAERFKNLQEAEKEPEKNKQFERQNFEHDFLKMEQDFCIDAEKFDEFIYEKNDFKYVNVIFDYLRNFSAFCAEHACTFRDLKIYRNLSWIKTVYVVYFAGVKICEVTFTNTYVVDVYIINENYCKYVAYIFDYILKCKKHFEHLEKVLETEHLDSVLENYYC